MKPIVLLSCAALLLSACAEGPPPPSLSEQLQGKTPEQRQEILRLACLNEAEHTGNKTRRATTGHRSHRHGDTAQTKRMKDICREMTDEYLPEKE